MQQFAVGIDLGGTNIKGALVERGRGLIYQTVRPTEAAKGPDHILDIIATMVQELTDEAPNREIAGIGIGSPGVINWERTTVTRPPNFPGWDVVNMQEALAPRCGSEGLPVLVENDANAAGLGSAHYGAGRPHDSFIMVTLGTGVGGAIIYNNHIFRGSTGGAAEIGHMTIDYEGPVARSGVAGAVEAYLGQNFLSDPNTARKIVEAIQAPPEGAVVEIGAGTGALTDLLLDRYPRLVAIEVDHRAVKVLRERFPDLDVRHEDVLEVDWQRLADGEQLYVIGNLPYYITSQILFALLEARSWIREAVLMMQLEVAERLVASPGNKTYGITSVILQQYADLELLFKVSRNVFYPRPDVASALVRVVFDRAEEHVDYDFFREVVRTAFNQRRKTLRNSLSDILTAQATALPEQFEGRRPEELTPSEFVRLTRHLVRPDRR